MRKILFLFLVTFFFLNVEGQNATTEKLTLTQVSSDKTYGYKPTRKHSIKVGSIKNEYVYISLLTGPNGEKIEAIRLGSGHAFKCKTAAFGQGLLDIWKITYKGLEKHIIIYLNGYEYDNPKCPIGLSSKQIKRAKN